MIIQLKSPPFREGIFVLFRGEESNEEKDAFSLAKRQEIRHTVKDP